MKRAIVSGLVSASFVCGAYAAPGQGIHKGPLTVSPYADVSGTYDSNVNKAPANEKEDVFFDSALGLRAGYTTYLFDLNALGFISHRNYADATDKDFGAGGEMLRAKYGNRDQIVLEADQTFRRIEDNDRYANEAAVGGVSPDSVLDVTSRSQRDVNQVGISAGKNITDKLELDAGYRFDDVNYDETSLFDLRNHVGQLETAYRLTDKTAGLLTVKGGLQENLSLDNEAEYYAARLGLKTKGTDKVTFKGGAGAQYYDQANGDSETLFNFDLVSAWAASDKIVFQAGGRNGAQMSSLYADNGTDYQIYWLGGTYRITPAISTTLSGAYRVDDYMNPVTDNGLTYARSDAGFGGRLRADYQSPAKFLKIYTEASYENMDSNVQNQDYTDTRIAMGAVLSY
jgi:hypothetical protein